MATHRWQATREDLRAFFDDRNIDSFFSWLASAGYGPETFAVIRDFMTNEDAPGLSLDLDCHLEMYMFMVDPYPPEPLYPPLVTLGEADCSQLLIGN